MFHDWDSFYLMLGSSGAALIGLLFVVVTLTADFERNRVLRAVSIYMTPTALDFGLVLAISALALTPHLTAPATAVLLGLGALVGLASTIRSCVGIRGMAAAQEPPHWSDFWLYGFVPAAVYVALGGDAVALWARAAWAVHATAALVLVLLLVGIRNAWDLITWMAPQRGAQPK
jgi:hypothetical protein